MAIFKNQATLTYSGLLVSSNVTQGELLDPLTVYKTALSQSYRINRPLTFAISIENTGTVELSGLRVVDDLGGYPFNDQTLYPLSYVQESIRYFVNGVPSPAPAVNPGPPLVISDLDLPAGANAMILYEAFVNEFAPLDSGECITNTAVVSSPTTLFRASASSVVCPDQGPELSVTKSLFPPTVLENGRISYTFVILNSGFSKATAEDLLSLSGRFDPPLSDLEVTLDAAPFLAYSYDSSTGLFSTTPGAITVPGATLSRNAQTGAVQIDPGASILTVSGTV